MLTLYYATGACSLAAHIVLEESGEKFATKVLDLAKGEQRSPEYLKIHPLGKVPALVLDDGTPLTENTAILPYLGKRYNMWPTELLAEAKALSVVGFFAGSVHPAHGHIGRPARYTADESAFPGIQAMGKKTFHEHLKQIDEMYAGREWLAGTYSVLDPYALVFYNWGIKRELPVKELKHYTAFAERMKQRPAVRRALADEGIKL